MGCLLLFSCFGFSFSPVEWLQPVLQFPTRVMKVKQGKKSQIKAESII